MTTKTFPVVKGWPLTGPKKEFYTDPLRFAIKVCKDYGEYFAIKPAPFVRTSYFITNPNGIQHILEKKHLNYKKSIGYKTLRLGLGDGILTSEGDKWKVQRKAIQPLFLTDSIQRMCDQMLAMIDRRLSTWITNDTKKLDVNDEIAKLTIEVAASCILGQDGQQHSDLVRKETIIMNEFLSDRMTSLIKLPLWVPTRKNKVFNLSKRRLDALTYTLIADEKRNPNDTPGLLSLLMQSSSMTDTMLRDELTTFLIAGHETTAVAICYTLYCLSRYSEKGKKVRDEILDVIKDSTPTAKSIQQLTYTKVFLKEVLRHYPPVWYFGRESIAKDTVDGYALPAGADIFLPIYVVHHSEKYWDNPYAFEPERFLGDTSFPKYAYFPFGGGPRTCIGMQFSLMEITLFLIRLVQTFDFDMVPVDLELETYVTMRPKNKLVLNLSKKQKP